MAPPDNDDEQSKETSLEKQELLKQIKHWESKFMEVDAKFNELSQKYDEDKQTIATKPPIIPSSTINNNQEPSNEIQVMKAQIAEALQGLKSLTEEVRSSSELKNKERVDELEQYLKRNSLLVKGLNIPPNTYGIDFIKFIVTTLNTLFPDLEEAVKLHHIDDAHPLKTKNGGKVIIVKFSCRWLKNDIYKCRSKLRGTDVSITEHLTSNSVKLLESVKAVVGKDTKVYTNNCVINLKFNNKKYFIRTFNDVQFLANRTGYRVPPPGMQKQQRVPDIPHDYAVQTVDPASAGFPYVADYNMFPASYNSFAYPYQNSLPPRGRASHYGRGRGFS